jgi:hypothetical protein
MIWQQNLYDCPWYLRSIFWWFKDVSIVGELNVCQHKTKLPQCANISSRYIGLHNSKHLKCVHLKFVLHMGSVLFSSFNSRKTLFYRSYDCRNPSLGFATKARHGKVAGQEGDSGVTSHAPGGAKSVREWTLTLPSELPCWELESRKGSRIIRAWLQGSKLLASKSSLYHWKAIEV